MKHFFWVCLNIYGRIFGRRSLSGLNQGLVLLGLHGLGYDNGWKSSFTGEEWFVKNILPNYDIHTCIDIGANIGAYSAMLLARGYDVYAIEPSSSSFERLRSIPGIKAFRLAISNVSGTASLASPAPYSPHASLDTKKLPAASVERVTTSTLDAFITAHGIKPDFIKIDTEGFEREVLEGLSSKPKVIQFEFNVLQLYRGYTLLSLANLLPEYTLYRLLPQGLVPVHPEKFVDNIFMFSNYIGLRND